MQWNDKTFDLGWGVSLSEDWEITQIFTPQEAHDVANAAGWHESEGWTLGWPTGQDQFKDYFFFLHDHNIWVYDGRSDTNDPAKAVMVCTEEKFFNTVQPYEVNESNAP